MKFDGSTQYVNLGDATDSTGLPLMPDIATSTVNPSVAGSYEVIWVAHDSQMNWATSTRTVIVADPLDAVSTSTASASTPATDFATSSPETATTTSNI